MKAFELKKIADAANGVRGVTELEDLLGLLARAARSGKYYLDIEYGNKQKIRSNLEDLGYTLTPDDDNSCTVCWDKTKMSENKSTTPVIKKLKLNQQGDETKPIVAGSVVVTKEMVKTEALKNIEEAKVKEREIAAFKVNKDIKEPPTGHGIPEYVVNFIDNLIGACPMTLVWGGGNRVIVKDLVKSSEEVYHWDNGWVNTHEVDFTPLSDGMFTALVMTKDKYNK